MNPSTSAPDHTAAPPAVTAWTRLLRAYASTTRCLSAQLAAEHGLTLNDFEALQLLSRSEDRRLRPVELARRLLLTPSGVTRLLEGLEGSGLVERVSCPSDRRVSYACLTDAGGDALASASCGHIGSVRALLEEALSPPEIEQLTELLGKLPGVADGEDACLAPVDH